jgi:hypothetical protein
LALKVRSAGYHRLTAAVLVVIMTHKTLVDLVVEPRMCVDRPMHWPIV